MSSLSYSKGIKEVLEVCVGKISTISLQNDNKDKVILTSKTDHFFHFLVLLTIEITSSTQCHFL